MPRPLDSLRELAAEYRERQNEVEALRTRLAVELRTWTEEGMSIAALEKATGLSAKVIRGLLRRSPPPS